MRKRTDQLYARSLGPREGEAFRSVEDQPGITIAELPDAVGSGMTRMWQIVPLEASPVHRERGREISGEHTAPSTREEGGPRSVRAWLRGRAEVGVGSCETQAPRGSREPGRQRAQLRGRPLGNRRHMA